MAEPKNSHFRPIPERRGQGTVEALVSLPVFLLLTSILFQVFFLAMAQLLLYYAAFCGARSGLVHNEDREQIERAVSDVLSVGLLVRSLPKNSYRVEIMSAATEKSGGSQISTGGPRALKVQIHLKYPLEIPFADILLRGWRSRFAASGGGSIPLTASWILPHNIARSGIEETPK